MFSVALSCLQPLQRIATSNHIIRTRTTRKPDIRIKAPLRHAPPSTHIHLRQVIAPLHPRTLYLLPCHHHLTGGPRLRMPHSRTTTVTRQRDTARVAMVIRVRVDTAETLPGHRSSLFP